MALCLLLYKLCWFLAVKSTNCRPLRLNILFALLMGIFPASLDLFLPTVLHKRLIEITEFLLFLKMYSPSSHLTYTAVSIDIDYFGKPVTTTLPRWNLSFSKWNLLTLQEIMTVKKWYRDLDSHKKQRNFVIYLFI